MAVEQCIASCQSVNFGESVTAARMMEYLVAFRGTLPCFELPGGERVTMERAVAALKGEN